MKHLRGRTKSIKELNDQGVYPMVMEIAGPTSSHDALSGEDLRAYLPSGPASAPTEQELADYGDFWQYAEVEWE